MLGFVHCERFPVSMSADQTTLGDGAGGGGGGGGVGAGGGGGGAGAGAGTAADWADVADTDPTALLAVTVTRIVAAASAEVTTYTPPVAPEMAAQLFPAPSQRFH